MSQKPLEMWFKSLPTDDNNVSKANKPQSLFKPLYLLLVLLSEDFVNHK